MPPKLSSSKKNVPYVPSYMKTSEPEEKKCVVCGDAATGLHYRAMTCEGCKGFFRRTRQRGLRYTCKGNERCEVSAATRNHCMQCRYLKCIAKGMAPDLVLDQLQRKAKRQLIAENRQRRETAVLRDKIIHDLITDKMTNEDKKLIQELAGAFQRELAPSPITDHNLNGMFGQASLNYPTESRDTQAMMSLAIEKLIRFSRNIPSFDDLVGADQISLLRTCCLELMVFRAALRYDMTTRSVILRNGMHINRRTFHQPSNEDEVLAHSMAWFADSLARCAIDLPEIVLMMAILLTNSLQGGIQCGDILDKMSGLTFGALRRYTAEAKPNDPSRYGRLLQMVLDLRTLCSLNGETFFSMKIEDGWPATPSVLFETIFFFQ